MVLFSRAESEGVETHRFKTFGEFSRSFMVFQMLIDKHSQVFVIVSKVVNDLTLDDSIEFGIDHSL